MMGHSSGGVIFHNALHFSKCSTGAPCPSYFCCWLLLCFAPNLMHSNHLHWYQSLIFSLCAPHHLVGVSLSEMSRDKNLWMSNTSSSYLIRNSSKSLIPWKLGGSLISIPTHLTAWSIHAHLLVETSCRHYCQFSRPVSKSEAHDVILLHLSTPSTIGLM
jgi:hypothetical protein